MKKIIEKLKEREIDKRLQEVVDFAKVTGIDNGKIYNKALKMTFIDMLNRNNKDIEYDVMNCVIDKGLDLLFKEMNIQPSEDVEVDNDIKTLNSVLEKLAELIKRGKIK